MNDRLYLIARLAGQRIAIDAGVVDSVVHVASITAVPLAPPHVAGLAALRSRVITMIDTRAALGLAIDADVSPWVTIVVTLDGHQYGLIVDRVDDVCTIGGDAAPVRAKLGEDWARVVTGALDHEGGSVLLLDTTPLVAGLRLAA